MESVRLDAAAHRRSAVTMPGYHRGRANEGKEHPADPPTVEQLVAAMSTVGDRATGTGLRAIGPAGARPRPRGLDV